MNIPKKRMDGNDSHFTKLEKFFDQCFQALLTINYEETKCIIIASPGFVKENFKLYCEKMVDKE